MKSQQEKEGKKEWQNEKQRKKMNEREKLSSANATEN